MSDIAIKVENLTKIYKLYNNPVDRLKESLHPFKKKYHEDFFALREVSFEVRKGETFGIIGKNGSGKSTLLKILTGVLTPNDGNVAINGRVSALLELGTGFNPEMTGIENVYFYGTINGYTKEQVDNKLDEVLAFADIGQFVHQPVKTYSSGMYVRLAFAVAINVDPDILIIDEALAVGDIRFQLKCFEKFKSFQESGRTILFVSHSTDSILQFCKHCCWLENGAIKEYGLPKHIVSNYVKYMRGYNNEIGFKNSNSESGNYLESLDIFKPLEEMQYYNLDESRYGNFEAKIVGFILRNSKSEITGVFNVRERYVVEFYIEVYQDIEELYISFGYKNLKGQDLFIYRCTPLFENNIIRDCKKGQLIRIFVRHSFPLTNWSDNKYTITPAISRNVKPEDENNLDDCTLVDIRYNAVMVEVFPDIKKYAGPYYDSEKIEFEVYR